MDTDMELVKTLDALLKENTDLKRQLYASQRIRFQLDKRIRDASDKQRRAINALQFYGDENNWRGITGKNGRRIVEAVVDGGHTARKTIYRDVIHRK